jgi:DNA repair exonuclease SbcCD nuclease subunit
MRFAHLADLHLGGWRAPKMRELGITAFSEAVRRCVEKKVDFVLISGDLFNTSIPPIDILKTTVSELKKLRGAGINVYTIAGSHDFSPSGKTMLDVLEEADLVKNVFKGDIFGGKLELRFTTDAQTGAKITGMIGRKGMLDKINYQELDSVALEKENGFRIFLFHTTISEMKPKELEKMDSTPLSALPRGFNYYAGGHVHIVRQKNIEGYENVVYPGPLFPNSFSELEKLENGGFYFYDDGKLIYEKISIHPVITINIDCSNKSVQEVEFELKSEFTKLDPKNAIILIRLQGVLESGKTTDLALSEIVHELYQRNAFFVMKNTSNLVSKEFEEIRVLAETAEETEELVLKQCIGQTNPLKLAEQEEYDLIKKLMSALDKEQEEGERKNDYDARIISEAGAILENIKTKD